MKGLFKQELLFKQSRERRKIYKGNYCLLYMKITFDKEADAVYIEISGEVFFNNRKIDDETIID